MVTAQFLPGLLPDLCKSEQIYAENKQIEQIVFTDLLNFGYYRMLTLES